MNVAAILRRLPAAAQLRDYRLAWLRFDLTSGLSVAAVSLPSAIAYPAIAGLPIEFGLFATIFALVGYALLGPSRRLMVGPDAATCIMLAGVLASLEASGDADRAGLATALTLAVGCFCFLAGLLRLGFLANFLSRPMLVGFLTGISVTLIIGQIKRMTAIDIAGDGLFQPIIALFARVGETHLPTLAVGLGTLALLRLSGRLLPSIPGPLLAIILGIALSAGLDLQSHGVAVLGALPEIAFTVAEIPFGKLLSPDLLGGAMAIMVVSFGNGIVTARSFAMKEKGSVNADKELFGFSAANIMSGLFGGFPVSASDSRTAVNFAIGGKTQLTALIAAAAIAGTVLLLSDILAYLPAATLGAVLISAAIDLIDLDELRVLWRISRAEFAFAMVTFLGVVIAGVLQGVFIAIAATLLHLVWAASHPRLALLGRIAGKAGLYKLHRYPDAESIPGLTIVVLQSGLVFFNADYVKRRLLKIAGATRSTDAWFVLDAAAVNVLDSTGLATLDDVREELAGWGVAFGIADLNSRARHILERSGLKERLGAGMTFPSAEAAVAAFEASATAKASISR